MTTRLQRIETFCEAAEMRGEAHRQRDELRDAAERNTLLAQQHRADLKTIEQLRTALAGKQAEIDALQDEVCRLMGEQVAA